jgi:hypothetical protein
MLHQLHTYIYARNGVEWRSKGCIHPQKACYELKCFNMNHNIHLVSHVVSESRCAIATSSFSPLVRSCLRAKHSFFLSARFHVTHAASYLYQQHLSTLSSFTTYLIEVVSRLHTDSDVAELAAIGALRGGGEARPCLRPRNLV